MPCFSKTGHFFEVRLSITYLIVFYDFKENIRLKVAAIKSNHLTEEQFDMYVRPEKVIKKPSFVK
jgi:hypothetical protein